MPISTNSIPLKSRINTSSEPITSISEEPMFQYKNSIVWNDTIRNAYITQNEGIVTTAGNNIQIKDNKGIGAELVYDEKSLPIKYNYLLTEKYKIDNLAAGKITSKAVYNDKLYSLWNNTENYSLVISNLDGSSSKQINLDATTAVLSSVYKANSSPILFTIKTDEVGQNTYTNEVKGYTLDNLETPLLTYNTDDYIPLGEANSATVLTHPSGALLYILGCDNIDHNRSRIITWLSTKKDTPRAYKWYGTVSPTGVITGEPIPDPDTFKIYKRNSNGTYSWDMKNGTTNYVAGKIIGGYTVPLTNQEQLNKIVIDEFTKDEWIRVNMSINDTKLATDDIEPKQYYVSNYADDKEVYYDYGQGWLKTYIRKCSLTSTKIKDCYLYTYGAKRINNLPYRKESLMAKGNTKEWDYTEGKLNQRVYTVGSTNKGNYSILSLIPFTVEITPSETTSNQQNLNMQVYGLAPLSFSFRKSLLCSGSGENGYSNYNLQQYDNYFYFLVDTLVFKIEKTSDYKKLSIEKLADYLFLTNILDNKNLIVEDHAGNINLERTAIPYNMECLLQIENSNIKPPSVSQTVANNAFYWAAAFNDKVSNGVYTNNNTTATSFLFPAITMPIYIDPTELSALAIAVLDNKGSFLNPLLKGIFNEYEGINVYYTLTSSSTVITYKTTNIVKESDVTTDRFDLYGKKTYEVSKRGTSYDISSYIYPIGVGTFSKNINYIQPTILLEENYSARLYMNNNRLYTFYLYQDKVFNGSSIFTIYGNNYYYDGQAIYFTGQGNTYTSNNFACYALGLKYLANSGAEAYFYSDFEKRLYIFTGSQTMQPADLYSSVGEITDAMFSSKEQMLYMLTNDNRVIIRSTTDQCSLDNIPDNSHLEGTDEGAAVVWDNGYFIYSPYKGTDTRPFLLETEYIGSDETQQKCSFADVLLYRITDKPITVKLGFHTLSGIEQKTEYKEYNIGTKDWKGRTIRLRYTPRNSTGNAFKLSISSNDEIAVSYLGFATDTIGGQGARR